MTDAERLQKIRGALGPILSWYRNILENGSPDGDDPRDYLYDMTWDEFNRLSRGDYCTIVEALL